MLYIILWVTKINPNYCINCAPCNLVCIVMFYQELLDYIESYTTLQLQLFQLRVSQVVVSYYCTCLVCLLFSYVNNTSYQLSGKFLWLFRLLLFIYNSDASMTTSDTVMNIRNMYSLVGVKHSPVFLRMTGNS